MTYLFKALIIAAISTTALTAQVSAVYAMGSDRDPKTTNVFKADAQQGRLAVNKNEMFANVVAHTTSPANADFLAQK
ncbi:MAG: hypothetical protein JKX71_09110 [Amylibacter sp.]|nr:hypothetical protein [Amylibacter sp.]